MHVERNLATATQMARHVLRSGVLLQEIVRGRSMGKASCGKKITYAE